MNLVPKHLIPPLLLALAALVPTVYGQEEEVLPLTDPLPFNYTSLARGSFAPEDNFGAAAAIQGLRVVVGAPLVDTVINNVTTGGAGAVYVYQGVNASEAVGEEIGFDSVTTDGVEEVAWKLDAVLIAPDPDINDELGVAVAVDGDLVAAGAWDEQANGVFAAGVVYMWRRNDTDGSWKQVARLSAEGDVEFRGYFGAALSFHHGLLVVGAWDGWANANNAGGKVFTFTDAVGDDSWSRQALITASDGAAYDRFGNSVSLDPDHGHKIAIAAEYVDGDGGSEVEDVGAIYVFDWDGAGWNESVKLMLETPEAGEELGSQVALSGNVIVAGAPRATVNGFSNAGKVYVWEQSNPADNTSWTLVSTLISAAPDDFDYFGLSVGLGSHGSILAVSTPFTGVGPTANTGKMALFGREASGWEIRGEYGDGIVEQGGAFGSCLALDHGTAKVVVGARGAVIEAPEDAFVFVGIDRWCGDGVQQLEEECEGSEECERCRVVICGNGIVQGNEECDPAPVVSVDNGGDLLETMVCGDDCRWVVELDEEPPASAAWVVFGIIATGFLATGAWVYVQERMERGDEGIGSGSVGGGSVGGSEAPPTYQAWSSTQQ